MNYVAEVADHLLSRYRKGKFLGAETYAAIAEWEKQGVPAELVRAAIDEAFLKTDGIQDGEVPVRLIRHVVMRNFSRWLTLEQKPKTFRAG